MNWTIDKPPARPERDDKLTDEQILDVLDLVGRQRTDQVKSGTEEQAGGEA